jgi:hypothetical protein
MSDHSELVEELEKQDRGWSVRSLADGVLVDLQNGSGHSTTGMDVACTVAYDHGYTPVGIGEGGASRFQPREKTEVDVK